MSKKTKAVILAGGLGTRMKSETPKVLHPLRGKPMIERVIDSIRASGIDDVLCIVGHNAEMVKTALKDVKTVMQKKPLGSADALNQAKRHFTNFTGNILVLYGDEPLIRPETLRRLKDQHKKNKNFCTLLSTRMADPTGYGRIVRDDNKNIVKIVEENEATDTERSIDEINVGAYYFKNKGLFSILKEVRNKNKKREYYLTDAIFLMREKNLGVDSVITDDDNEALGVNSRKDLARAEEILRQRILMDIMQKGVTIIDPNSTYIDDEVSIGRDTTIYPYTMIEKDVEIGENCKIGPFARIRPGSRLDDGVEIGNFVEVVRTRIGENTKAKHHTYLGDAVIGKNVNIGAGTITANYDGRGKYVTKIDDGAFIGSGTIFVAPVKVGRNAVTAAGAVVTKNHNVPPNTIVAGIPARRLKKEARDEE